MISRKTIISLALVFAVSFSSCAVSYADTSVSSANAGESQAAAEKLYTYGLFKGGAYGFDLNGTTTKAEAAAMVVRLLGAEDDALSGAYHHPYKDVNDWSSDYIGYLYENGVIGDTADGAYHPGENADTAEFLAMVLNALGYVESGQDLTEDQLFATAVSCGLLTEAEAQSMKSDSFTRGTLVLIADDALDTKLSGADCTLFQFLDSMGGIESLAAPSDEVRYGSAPAEPEVAEPSAEEVLTDTIISNAKQYLGIRYRSGGKSPSTGFDCSGYVGYVMIKSGVWNQFYGSCDGVIAQCKTVSKAEAKPGDLVFFKNTYNTSKTYTHVGIYLGNNQMIHSASSSGISISSFSSGYWASHYACIARPTAMM